MRAYDWRVVNGVGTLRFTHPPVNVLTTRMLTEMSEVLREAHSLRLVCLRGAGPIFSAGMDIGEHLPPHVAAMLQAVRGFFEAVWALPCPVMAAVHGRALGGAMELLLLCDVVVASRDAVLALPEVRVGAIPPLGALLLPQRLPWPRAAEMLLTGREVTAEEAHAWGLVNHLVEPADFEHEVSVHADAICALSPVVQRHVKRAMHRDPELFARLAEVERDYLEQLMQSHDAVEGLRAFLEKRPPTWMGR